MTAIPTNIRLREALRLAIELGARVGHVRGTGETRIDFPGERPLRVTARRHDAPRKLLTYLRRAERRR